MNKRKYKVGLLLAFLTLFFAIVLCIRIFRIDPGVVVTPISKTFESIEIPFMRPRVPKIDSLHQTVQTILDESSGNYGVVIKNLKGNETYTYNEHQEFLSGSLYKLWIMATVYDQIKKGQLHETDILQQEIPILNEKFNISTENAELIDGDIMLSVSDALERMITFSDNYAALLLSEKVRLSNVAKFLDTKGFTESKVGTDGSLPTTTPSDIAKFFTSLYTGSLIDKTYDEKMLRLLKKQEINHKIPKYLPHNTVVAHKTGELDVYSHDAGIVYAPKNDYIIVIFSESDNPPEAEKVMAKISETVYQFFTK